MSEKIKLITWVVAALATIIYFILAKYHKWKGNSMDALWYMGLAIYFLVEADILGGWT